MIFMVGWDQDFSLGKEASVRLGAEGEVHFDTILEEHIEQDVLAVDVLGGVLVADVLVLVEDVLVLAVADVPLYFELYCYSLVVLYFVSVEVLAEVVVLADVVVVLAEVVFTGIDTAEEADR